MQKTVLITGSSTGIGKETALLFHRRGWRVVATMRHPDQRTTDLHQIKEIELRHLDVTDFESIRAVVQSFSERCQGLDVVVNNAGYSLSGVFEAASREQIAREFDTNVFGLMEVTRQVLPIFRAQRQGTIINIASIAGRMAFPGMSLYHSTKWAVEGFSESLYYEVRPLNIRVKIIEPGAIRTDFYDRSMDFGTNSDLADYRGISENMGKRMKSAAKLGSSPKGVARTIYRAATDRSWKLRYPTGRGAWTLFALRRLLPHRLFHAMVRAGT